MHLPNESPFPFSLEHIIIDGASTDGSVDVIRNYEKSLTNISVECMLKRRIAQFILLERIMAIAYESNGFHHHPAIQ